MVSAVLVTFSCSILLQCIHTAIHTAIMFWVWKMNLHTVFSKPSKVSGFLADGSLTTKIEVYIEYSCSAYILNILSSY